MGAASARGYRPARCPAPFRVRLTAGEMAGGVVPDLGARHEQRVPGRRARVADEDRVAGRCPARLAHGWVVHPGRVEAARVDDLVALQVRRRVPLPELAVDRDRRLRVVLLAQVVPDLKPLALAEPFLERRQELRAPGFVAPALAE